VSADLATPEGRETLAAAARALPDIGLVVHAAWTAKGAPIETAVATGYSALHVLTQATLPTMLARQAGTILFVVPTRESDGLDDTSAVQTMVADFVGAYDRQNAQYGIRGITLFAGPIAGCSAGAFPDTTPVLLAQEVAEAAAALTAATLDADNVVVLTPEGSRYGVLGFHERRIATVAAPAPVLTQESAPMTETGSAMSNVTSPAADIVHRVLRLPVAFDLSGAMLGVTPGWDSLKHIDLLLEIERVLAIRFSSLEMEATQNFVQLDQLCRSKVASTVAR
jgi:acyl carrier protein